MPHQMQATVLDEIGQFLAEHGFDDMARGFTVLLNELMKPERTQALGNVGLLRELDRLVPS